ncbi:MAG: hypothetical protein FWC41_05285 [Firmicutes bacterium]|nr:hypothetical protein [Bacillota bacterium]
MPELLNFDLPEFVFLDGNSPSGDTLEHRTVLMHIRTATVLEVIAIDDLNMYSLNSEVRQHKFTYTNFAGIKENHLFAVHFSLDEENLEEIFARCEKWYCEYLRWEDDNILTDEQSKWN